MVSIDYGVPVVSADWDTAVAEPGHAGQEALYVSTSLATWRAGQPKGIARDFQIDDTCYRRLDPEYYAWLRSRMHMGKLASAAGRLPEKSFDELRAKFNAVHEWAMGHFGEAVLAEAVNNLNARDYQPPAADSDSTARNSGHRNAADDGVPAEAITMLDAICERALALGWKRERFYGTGNGRIFSQNRGLVSFLKPGDRIGEVTRQSIEIIGPPPSEVRQHFYNPDVDQLWIIRLDHKEKLEGTAGHSPDSERI
jgi:hypothetical protein